jgi:hypothetical protein
VSPAPFLNAWRSIRKRVIHNVRMRHHTRRTHAHARDYFHTHQPTYATDLSPAPPWLSPSSLPPAHLPALLKPKHNHTPSITTTTKSTAQHRPPNPPTNPPTHPPTGTAPSARGCRAGLTYSAAWGAFARPSGAPPPPPPPPPMLRTVCVCVCVCCHEAPADPTVLSVCVLTRGLCVCVVVAGVSS